jgi:hypothetical protein
MTLFGGSMMMAGAAQGGGAPPDAFEAGDWTAVGNMAGGTVVVTIGALPADNGSAITDLEYRVDAGSWVSFGAATTGSYNITGLDNWTEVDIEIRAVSAGGAGAASDLKAATPESPNLLSNGDFSGGTTSWSFGSPTWSLESGPKALHTANGSNTVHLTQGGLSITPGNNYRLRFTVADWAGSGANAGQPFLTGGSNKGFVTLVTNTNYDVTIDAASGNNGLRLPGNTTRTWSAANVILQDLGPA